MRRVIAIAMCITACGMAGCSECPTALDWGELPELPAAPGEITNIGLAGPFAGLHNDALIVAGGANFPTPLLKDGKKVWWDDIFVLRKTEEDTLDDFSDGFDFDEVFERDYYKDHPVFQE